MLSGRPVARPEREHHRPYVLAALSSALYVEVATALPVVGVPLTPDLLVRAVAVLAPALGEVDTGAQPTVEVPAVEEPKPEPLVMTAEEFVERNARSLAEVDAQ